MCVCVLNKSSGCVITKTASLFLFFLFPTASVLAATQLCSARVCSLCECGWNSYERRAAGTAAQVIDMCEATH